MINTGDLHIEDEILPLFDFTFNLYSGMAVREILTKPLGSKEDALFRQQLLKGFIANHEVFKTYSFSRFNMSELYDFLSSFSAGSFSGEGLWRKLLCSEKERHQRRGKLILLFLLFNKLQSAYFNKIDTKHFPEAYAAEIKSLNDFIADFNPGHYEMIFRKKKIRIKHIVELTKIIAEKIASGKVDAFWNRWFLFEAYLSISHGILKHGFVFPVFDDANFLLEGIYHPLLKEPVKNDVVANNNVILLTGPNMSGKSTLLKAVSLCVYLGHTGLAVPASKVTTPFFTTISVAINLTDSIVSGYSHFMTEIITLKNVLTEARGQAKCFAVFDELFRGTNIEDALEISTATIKGLVNFTHSLFFISTHLHQLKSMEEIQSRKIATWYIDCELAGNIPVFTYKLKEGWSDVRVGRILFEKEGLYKMLKQ
jgi:DNA mismatch repair protein MutS